LSSLLLVRHGQASFLADDYDVLSPLGEEQARQLGRHLARVGLRVDEVWSGPRVRQLRTAELAAQACAAAGGAAWPAISPHAALDEYHAEHVMKHAAAELALRDEAVRELALAFAQATERRERARGFEKLFQAVTRRWVAGELVVPGIETWAEFEARVHAGLAELTADGGRGGRNVLAFTSAGTIGVSLQAVLGVPAVTALELGWVVRNASVTELLFSGGRVTLSSFNTLAHLPDPAHWTYR
jgi:broad specificity phosphatase PhoE